MGGGTREMWGHWVPGRTEDVPLPQLASLLPCLSCSQSPWASTAQPLPPQISRPVGHVGAWLGAHGPTAAALSSRHCLQASVSVPNVKNGGNNMKCDKHLTCLRPRSR